jgi:exopolysaccharide biosynthesis predicted pyruvyltransferase EpsI
MRELGRRNSSAAAPGHEAFWQIRDYLKTLEGEEIVFQPNRGNAGDALIALAAYRLFDDLGLRYRVYRDGDDLSDAVLVYGGGGNLVPQYSQCARFLAAHLEHAMKVVILPHTIAEHADLLARFGSNVEVICREHISYEYVRRAAASARVFLMHDMALTLDPGDILANAEWRGSWVARPREGKVRPASHRYRLRRLGADIRLLASRLAGRPTTLDCFRRDWERTDVRIPWGNVDLSTATPYDRTMAHRSSAEATAFELFRYLDRFEVINTNRLHVGIAGALLGKRVGFAPNVYWKNEAVYRHSLREAFPRVEWEGP